MSLDGRSSTLRIAQIAKVLTDGPDFGKYDVKSNDCPCCALEGISVLISPESLYAYNQGALADVVLANFDADTRERFISGMCGKCWDLLASMDEGDESDVSDEEQ